MAAHTGLKAAELSALEDPNSNPPTDALFKGASVLLKAAIRDGRFRWQSPRLRACNRGIATRPLRPHVAAVAARPLFARKFTVYLYDSE